MTQLILEWMEGTGPRSETIHPQQLSKNPGTVRLGRDPSRCDIVLNESSVSGLHIEIFYDAQQNGFVVRSLRDSNPPMINGQRVPTGTVPLGAANTIQLGRLQLTARSAIPATEVVAPSAAPPAAGVPPTIVSAGDQLQSIPTPSVPLAAPPQVPQTPPACASPAVSQQSGPRIWVWLIAGIVVLAGGALAVPTVINLMGGRQVSPSSREDRADRETADRNSDRQGEETSSDEDSFQEKMKDLVTYTHENDLFTVQVPRTWERQDNSSEREVIVTWTDPKTGSTVLINLFRVNRRLNNNDLGDIATRTLRSAYSSRPDFRLGEPEFFDDHVRVKAQFSTRNGTLLGRTFIQQVRNMVSAPRIYILESQAEESEETVQEILDSYRFFPNAQIP